MLSGGFFALFWSQFRYPVVQATNSALIGSGLHIFLLMFVLSSRLMCQYVFVVVFQSGQRPGAASWLQRREVSDSSKRVPPSGERVICPSRCNFSSFYLLLWRSSHFQLCGKHTAWAVNFLCKVTFPDYVQITQHTQNTHTQDAPTDKGLR